MTWNGVAVFIWLQAEGTWTVDDLGATLRQAREAAGITLSGMAARTPYSKSHLGNVECGTRSVTPDVIRAYERVLGDDMDRRQLLVGAVSALVAAGVPDVASDIAMSVRAQRYGLLASTQTSHAVDKTIAALVSRDTPSVAALTKWARTGSPVLRVSAAGILAKVGSPLLDGQVARHLVADAEVRGLYLTAVASRVFAMLWDEAGQIVSDSAATYADRIAELSVEVANAADAGARWCSIVLLARARPEARDTARLRRVRAVAGRRLDRTAARQVTGRPAAPAGARQASTTVPLVPSPRCTAAIGRAMTDPACIRLPDVPGVSGAAVADS
ncbi:helix-turn-helix domain-containing protein [Dactylosporangium sp. CA-139114]|uniref:helix-turn-helix domain-containing protein n=1 Tax=Dactylosporangium sp. CA-139114 TaxID=3239931 RepID=UPI003D955BF8